MDQTKLREQIDRGAGAQKLLDSPILKDAFDSIEKEISEGWQNSQADEKEQRENAYFMHRAVKSLRDKLKGYVSQGGYAQKQLEKDNERT